MPIVIGCQSPPRLIVEAKMKSDHAHRNANSDTVTIEFRLTGSTMERKVRHVPAPSIFAADMSSSGMPAMNAVLGKQQIETPFSAVKVKVSDDPDLGSHGAALFGLEKARKRG